MRLGYNTNGLANHRWRDALELIAEAGFESVAITVDHHFLDPFSDGFAGQVETVRAELERLGLRSVIETGARFLLDPRHKHEPTLVSPTSAGRRHRVEFLARCIRLAEDLQSDAVSLWSGILHDDVPRDEGMNRLVAELRRVLDFAAPRNVRVAFEPEPGMLIATMDEYRELLNRCDAPHLGLTLDVGHIHCLNDGSIPEVIRTWRDRLWNVHIEDMLPNVHEHLAFGEGSIDFPPIFDALAEIAYDGGVHVELSRHGHDGPNMVRESARLLTGWRAATLNSIRG